MRRRTWARLALVVGALALALILGEAVLRLVPRPLPHAFHTEDADGRPIDFTKAEQRGLVVPVEGAPRPRSTWAPNLRFFMCYRGGKRAYMDAQGRVEARINALGIRDREDLTFEKPSGEYRIVCVGDSFTFGWGIPAELAWPRLLESELAPRHARVRTVNCGASGAIYLDEYCVAARTRFARFAPDLVLITICLNDIAVIPGAVILKRPQRSIGPAERLLRRYSNIADMLWTWRDRARELELDREPDPGRTLLEALPDNPIFAHRGEPWEVFWAAGKSRAALRELQEWCAARGVRLGVIVWPLLQGLEHGAFYPFAALHDAVREFCAQQRIDFLDLLPALRGQDSRSLWVDPGDPHANEIAQRIATPAIAAFVEGMRCLPGR